MGNDAFAALASVLNQSAAVRCSIRVAAGRLAELASLAEEAIIAAKMPVFQRGDKLVRPVTREVHASGGRMTLAAGLVAVIQPSIRDLMAQSANWIRWDGRSKKDVPADPPNQVADVLLARVGAWGFPTVTGVITTPTLRPDGSILASPGHDSTTRLYHAVDPALLLPTIPDQPSEADAHAALSMLADLLTGFPFVDRVSRSVALSALITPVLRGGMSVAPLHALRATTAGTGKSYLVDVASTIATGRPCPVVAAGADKAETEKRLVGLLLAGFPLISLDNVNGELSGDLLCQATERPLLRLRKLGDSDIIEIESRATLYATGNNLQVCGDMVRRTLVGSLDANMERPELRSFAFDPVERVLADRGRYVVAALTITRAFLAAGEPKQAGTLASYADWDRFVRQPLMWLGCADPIESMETARDDDPELTVLREVLTLWVSAFKFEGWTLRDVAAKIEERLPTQIGEPTDYAHPDLREALLQIAGVRGALDSRRLGHWMRGNAGKIVTCLVPPTGVPQGLKIIQGKPTGGVARWAVVQA